MRFKNPVLVGLAAVGLFGLALTLRASALAPVTEGYFTNDKPPLGAIVSLEKSSTDYVRVTTQDNVNNILGVVVAPTNSPISITSLKLNQVQVASTGLAQVLVSDINGDIYAGDQITASPISGVGMKATSNAKVVGVAQANLSASDPSEQSYTDKKGKKHTVKVGQIPLLVSVSYYFKQPDKTIIPAAIQNIANALAGKTVKSLPVLISMGIFLVTIIVVVSIIYAMIHSSIISVGRNPMSQAAIYRNLIQMSILVIGLLGMSVIAIYFILARLG